MPIKSGTRSIASIAIAFVMAICSLPACGQTPYTPDIGNVGLPDNGVLHGTGIETVQLNNGNLHIDIPLLHLAGIGMDSDFHLTYDSQVWNQATGPVSQATNAPNFTLVTMSRPPWQMKDPMAAFLKWGQHPLQFNCQTLTGNLNLPGQEYNTDIDFSSFTDSDGTAHRLPFFGILPSGYAALCSVPGLVGAFPTMDPNGHFQGYSDDQSGYRLITDGSFNVLSFADKHGTQYTFSAPTNGASGLPAPLAYSGTIGPSGVPTGVGITNPAGAVQLFYSQLASVEDSNGNRITGTYNSNGSLLTITDTVDRTITEDFGSSAPCTPSSATVLPVSSESIGKVPCTISYRDSNGPESIAISYGFTDPISNVPNCSTGAQGCGTILGQSLASGPMIVPTGITLQNGDSYSFSYTKNPGDTGYMGEITQIILPTGGTINYTWGGLNTAGSGRYLVSRSVTANGQTSTWNYHYAYNSPTVSGPNSGPLTVTVTNPNQNDTVYTCNSNPTGASAVYSNATCFMTKEVSYNGLALQQNPLATKTTGYSIVGVSFMPTSEIMTWNATGATTETDTTYDTFTPPVPQGFTVPSLGLSSPNVTLGNVMSKAVYDYATGSHGALISYSQYAYLHQQDSMDYVPRNILDRPVQASIYNSTTVGSASLVAQSTTAYDNFSQTAQSGLSPTTGTVQHDYTTFSSAYRFRGLPTSVTKYVNSTGTTITSYINYNDLGKPTISTDARNYSTKYAYDTANQNAYLVSRTLPTVNGITQVFNYQYDVNTGLLIHSWDSNNNETSHTYDSRMRPLTESRPDGGSTVYSYPNPNQVTTTTTENSSSSASTAATGNVATSITTNTYLDGLGRKTTTATGVSNNPIDPGCVSLSSDITYDLLGRVQTASNTHCVNSNDTDGLTAYTYDALSRLIAKHNPDGSGQSWQMNGNIIDFYDETGRHWQHTYDAENRLVKVMEPNGGSTITATPSMQTDYRYDTLGNLLTVTQWGGASGSANARLRSFAYDGLSRLVAANNPETSGPTSPAAQSCAGTTGTTWTSCYVYDNNGNLTQKKDNRGVVITYAYDAINRLTGKTYSDTTPPVTFSYDTSSVTGHANDIGEMTLASVKNGSTVLAQTIPYNYDAMGRVLGEEQSTPANGTSPYQLNYTYDTMSKTTSITMPSAANGVPGQALTLNFQNNQGRLNGATSSWSSGSTYPATLFSAPYANTSPASYGPVGLLNATLGISSTQPAGVLTVQRAYDARGRVVTEVDSAVSGSGTAATDSTGTITIAGTEQSKTLAAAPGKVTLTVSGVDGTTQVCTTTTTTQCSPSGNVCYPVTNTTCSNVPSTGAFTFTLWKDEFTPYVASAGYAGGTTDAQLATALASAVTASGGPVTATASGNSVVVSANSTGPSTDYAFTISNSGNGYGVSENVPYGQVGGNLAGGTVANPSDTGTISVTISGSVTTIPFGAGSTPTSLATALASAINSQDGGYVATSHSGGAVSLTSKQAGTAGDWPISESVTYDTAHFSASSFTVTDSNMNGGVNQSNALYSYAIPLIGGYDTNGNLLNVTDSVMGTWAFTYDNLNRLTNANSPSGYYLNVAMSWNHDAFGNRMAENVGAIPGASPAPQISMPGTSTATYSTSNQFLSSTLGGSGILYDAAGDVTYDGKNSYLYDAEGRVCAVKNVSNALIGYVYDGAGIRVAKGSLTSFSCNFSTNGFAANTSWALDASNQQIGEWQLIGGAWTWQHSNVYAGKLLGTYDTKGLHFYFDDWLGTRRIQTNALGQLEQTCQSLPYGNGENCTTTALATADDPTEQHFTGKERDTESGNDYFGARYYASSMGRFLSPDPVQLKANRLINPQRLNLYAYAVNNPLINIDPDGKDAIAIVFPNYKIQTPMGKLGGIGHAGVVTIDSKGRTKYFEYGRYDKEQKGLVNERTVPSVVMGSDGKPTTDSMNKLMKSISDQAGQGGKIEGAYFKANDQQTQKMDDYAEGRLGQNNDPNRTPYSLDDNHCGTFMDGTIEAGGIKLQGIGDQWPDHQLPGLEQDAGNKVQYDPSKQQTTITPVKKDGTQ